MLINRRPSKPPPPTVELSTTVLGERCITLTWGLVKEKVRYWRVSNATDGVVKKTQDTLVCFEGLREDESYSFRLCGVNERGQGDWSSTVHVHPDGSVDIEDEAPTNSNGGKDEQIARLQAEVQRLQLELTAALELVVTEKHQTTEELERTVARLEADKAEKSRLLIQAAEVMKDHELHVQKLEDANLQLSMDKEELQRQLLAKEHQMRHLEENAVQHEAWMADWQQQQVEMERKIRRDLEAQFAAQAAEAAVQAEAEAARAATAAKAEAERIARRETRERERAKVRAEEQRQAEERARAAQEEAAAAQAKAEADAQAQHEAEEARLQALEDERLRSIKEEARLEAEAAHRAAQEEARRKADADRKAAEDARVMAEQRAEEERKAKEERMAKEEAERRQSTERERARALADAAKAKADRAAKQKADADKILSRKTRVSGPPDMEALERRMSKAMGTLSPTHSPRSSPGSEGEPMSPSRKTVDGQIERAMKRKRDRAASP